MMNYVAKAGKIFLDCALPAALTYALMQPLTAEIEVLQQQRNLLQQLRTSKNIDIAEAALKRERVLLTELAKLEEELRSSLESESTA